MKTPRRNFVVEYKTTRRQAKVPPTSIWGNLDLQAMARAVEAGDAVPKADLPRRPSVLEDVAAAEPKVTISDAQADADGSSASPAATSSPSEPPIGLIAVGDDMPSPQEQPASAPARASKSRARFREKTGRSDIANVPAVLDGRLISSEQSGSPEELAVLEAENRHLKRLMVAKIRKENDRLKSMLRRFGDV